MVAIQKKLGEAIRNLRKDNSITQEQLAIKTKMDLTSINEIENGRRNPSLKTITKIANALGTTAAKLLD